jgi:hypothetical protein
MENLHAHLKLTFHSQSDKLILHFVKDGACPVLNG